ncbi:SWI/SNF chromatin-remodeling complex subunit SNF5, partial [Ascoidea rubescens DSM 1968]
MNININTESIWGDGYKGYGNNFTNTKTRVILPNSKECHFQKLSKYFNDVKLSNSLNLSRHQDKKFKRKKEELVPIRLEFDVEKDKFRLRDTFTWNLNEEFVSLETFVKMMMEDYKLNKSSYTDAVLKSIKEQINDYHSSIKKKPIDLRIIIKFDITLSNNQYIDKIEWDLGNPLNNPEEFAESVTAELSLPGEYSTAIAHTIREQSQLYTKALYLSGYEFNGELVKEEEIKRYLLPIVEEQNIFRSNVKEQNEFTPILKDMDKLGIEKLEKDRERESRRKRRNTGRVFNRRGIPSLPDLSEIQRTFRTAVPNSILAGGISLSDNIEDYYEY